MDARLMWPLQGFNQWTINIDSNKSVCALPGDGALTTADDSNAHENGANIDRYSGTSDSQQQHHLEESFQSSCPDEPDDEEDVDGSSCYLCTQCGKGFGTEKELESHVFSTHDEDDDEEEMADCNGTADIADNVPFEDMEVKPTMRHQYACKLCPRTFAVSSALNVHYTHTHKDKPQYDCELCGLAFTVKRELATHKRSHEGQPTHRCRQCGKEFGTKQLLRKHELWHTGERSHVCPQCGKAFFQKGHLTQHLMIHAGGRPHVCVLCQKTFIFKFDLNRHMKIHAERIIVAAAGSPDTNNASSDVGGAFFTSTTNNDKHDEASVATVPANVNSIFTSLNMTSLLTPMFRNNHKRAANGRSLPLSFINSALAQQKNEPFSDDIVKKGRESPSPSPEVAPNEISDRQTYEHPQDNGEHRVDEECEVSPANSVSSTSATSFNGGACCEQCINFRSDLESSQRRLKSLTDLLESRNHEVEALKTKLTHVGEVTMHLLETCSEFDKLWMLHSKKVYSKIQNVLNSLE